LAIFIIQNTEDVRFDSLVELHPPLWLYTIVTAVFGALVWSDSASCVVTDAARNAAKTGD
jgi:uncharacterized integral membrane protein